MSYCKIPAMVAAFLTAGSMPAFAYLDPGTGSIIAQAAIGGVVAAGVFWRAWWHRTIAFFQRDKTSDGEAAAEIATDPDTGRP